MSKFQKPLVIFISISVLAIFFLQLDSLFAGRIPRIPSIQSAANLFSLVGDGFFLLGVAAVLYISGAALKKTGLKLAARESAFSIALGGVIVHLLKASFERPRIAHGAGSVIKLLENPALFDLTGRFNSFPSGHATAGFAVAYVLSKRYPRLSVFFYLIALLIAASRVWLGSHYPTDVLAGAFAGICAGYLIVNKTKTREKWLIAGLSILIIFMSFFKSGGFLLFDVDEAVFSEASREMVETGDFITPTYNYEPRYDKPILFYWFMSIAFKLFGVTEFGARFTSGLFGAFLVFMTFLFVRHLKGNIPAFFAALALLLNIEFFIYSHSAVTDMTLALFITASLFSFFLAFREGGRHWHMLFWAFSALAVLTKGVIGVLFPVTIGFVFLLLSKELSKARPFLKPSYIGLFLLISAPWFAVQFYINGWDFFNAFIVKHHIQRYSDVISSHSGPFYYYIGVLLIGFFPWVAFLPSAVYKGLRERLDGNSALYLFTAIWFLFVLIFFSAAKTKLPNYIFPLFPPAGIAAGLVVSGIIERGGKKLGIILLIILALLFAAAAFMIPSMDIKMDVALPAGYLYFLGAVFLATAVFSAAALARPLLSFVVISALSVVLIVSLRLYAIPPLNIYLQKTLYDYARYARNLNSDDTFASYEINKPSLAFYAGRKVAKIEKTTACNIKEYAKKGDILVITTPGHYAKVEELKALKVIDQSGHYILLGNDSKRLPPFAR